MRLPILASDLPALNLLLAARPELVDAMSLALREVMAPLAALVEETPVPASAQVMRPPPPVTIEPPKRPSGTYARTRKGSVGVVEWEERLVGWFKAHPEGKFKLADVRADIGEPDAGEEERAFKVALHRAILMGQIASTGLRGVGAAYWIGKHAA